MSLAIASVLATAAPAPLITELKSPAAPESLGPNLAVGVDGRVIMSWLEPDTPKGYVLRFSTRGPQGWSVPKTIARGTNWFVSAADVPSMAVMPDGTLAADWFVATGGPTSEAYDVSLVFSKDGGAAWSKPMVPHRDG